MIWWKTLSYFCNKKIKKNFFLFAVLSGFLFIDTRCKFCLSDRTLQNAKVGESFQVEGNWVCKTDTDWFSKCQAVILSNKSHNHNRRGSLSSSSWKRRYLKKKKKKWRRRKCFIYSPVLPASVHNSEDFCSAVRNDRYNLDIPDSLNHVTGRNIRTNFGCHRRWERGGRREKDARGVILAVFELSQSCQSTAMLTIDSCANVSAPRMAVRVYKTHFSTRGNDRMQWVKTTKLSQTAVCADNYQIYLLTTIRQRRRVEKRRRKTRDILSRRQDGQPW